MNVLAGIDDGDAGEHVAAVDPGPQLGVGLGQVDAGIDALGHQRIVVAVGVHDLAVGGQDRDDVGQVQLALVVLVGDPVERRPQPVAADDVVPAVHLEQRALGVIGVTELDDRLHGSPASAHDPPEVAADRLGAVEREQRGRRARLAVRRHHRKQGLRLDQRVVGVHDQHVAGKSGQRLAAGQDGITGAARAVLDGGRRPSGHERVELRLIGRDDHHGRIRAQRLHRGQRPAQQRAAAGGVQQLGQARLHARALAGGEDEAGERLGHFTQRGDWGAWIRTRGRGTKTRCLTTWPRPIAVRSGNHHEYTGSGFLGAAQVAEQDEHHDHQQQCAHDRGEEEQPEDGGHHDSRDRL